MQVKTVTIIAYLVYNPRKISESNKFYSLLLNLTNALLKIY